MNKKYPYEGKFFIVAKNVHGIQKFKDTGITMHTKIEDYYMYDIIYDIADKLDLLDMYLVNKNHFHYELLEKATNGGKLKKTTIRKVVHTIEDLFRKNIYGKNLYKLNQYCEKMSQH